MRSLACFVEKAGKMVAKGCMGDDGGSGLGTSGLEVAADIYTCATCGKVAKCSSPNR